MPIAKRASRKVKTKISTRVAKPKTKGTRKPKKRPPGARASSALGAKKGTSTRLKGLDSAMYKMAAKLLPRRAPLLTILKVSGLTPDMVLRIAKLIEETLRARLPRETMAPSFVDVLSQSRDRELLSAEGYHLATRIRHIRNGIAHGQTDSARVEASCVLAMSCAALFFSEIDSRR